jgi:hypothetical protein
MKIMRLMPEDEGDGGFEIRSPLLRKSALKNSSFQLSSGDLLESS